MQTSEVAQGCFYEEKELATQPNSKYKTHKIDLIKIELEPELKANQNSYLSYCYIYLRETYEKHLFACILLKAR